jgi:hypothetical protein
MCSKVKFHSRYWVFLVMLCCFSRAAAQGCPPNIGFEMASFQNWETSLGRVDSANGVSLSYGFDPTRHAIFKNTGDKAVDRFGGFPVNCPNGSGASIKLGNETAGAQAEGTSYTFTIPADRKAFSLIYYYAVVMQNPPHGQTEQPKFTAKVFNVTKGEYITCSSFEYIAQAGLPGFESSPKDGTVLYKDWTPVTIKLSNYAGNTIRLEFVTNDCTRGGHFGYAYVDVDENCLSPIGGNIVCQYDSILNLRAPYGFQSYRWFSGDFSSTIGTGSSYENPVIPPDNTEFAVELTPYPDQGCPDTVFTKIHYSTESIQINAPQNAIAGCEDAGVDFKDIVAGMGNTGELLFTFYSDPGLTKHLFSGEPVRQSGTYYIKGVNNDGCFASKPVIIQVNPVPVYTTLIDPIQNRYCGREHLTSPQPFPLSGIRSLIGRTLKPPFRSSTRQRLIKMALIT